MSKRVALFEACSLVGLPYTRHEVFDLRAVGLPQVKASGLDVVSDHDRSPLNFRCPVTSLTGVER